MRSLALALVAGLVASSTGLAAARLRPTASAGLARKPATVSVAIEGMRFSSADLTVRTGDTVVWTNKDIVAHTVTSKTGAFDSKLIPPGGTWKYAAKKTGTFSYACTFHPLMTATLKVK